MVLPIGAYYSWFGEVENAYQRRAKRELIQDLKKIVALVLGLTAIWFTTHYLSPYFF